jgi:hypothetical protein
MDSRTRIQLMSLAMLAISFTLLALWTNYLTAFAVLMMIKSERMSEK